MRTRRMTIVGMLLALALTATALPAAADSDWDRGARTRGNVNVSASGGSARVGASTTTKSGGVAPATNGNYVSYPDGPATQGTPVAPTQICRLVHPGEIDFSNNQKSITVCYTPDNPTTPAAADTPTATAAGPSPQTAAASAIAQLSVPTPQLKWSPNPADNEWNAWAIGLPIWVDFEAAAPISTSTSASGITIDMTANQSEIHIDWGDGTSSTCTRWGPMPHTTTMGTESPWCGHTWKEPAVYTVTVTSAWTVSWSAMRQTGTLPLTSTSTTTIDVAEFQAIIVG